jgi:peptidyl-tRNA hydrolase
LAARVCPWLVDAPAPDEDEADDIVRAMTLVLRIERPGGPVEPPTRTALLEASAAAALALCLDERAGPDGPWADAVAAWAGAGRIRKLARRARTSHWRAVQEIEGTTVSRTGQHAERAEVRALVPGDVEEVAHEVSRLQIGGTDLPADNPGPPPPGRPTVWLSPEVEQTTGKAAAQVGHASMILATVLDAEGADPSAALEASVRIASPATWAAWAAALADDPSGRGAWEGHGVVAVRDAGFTEVAPDTMTCIAERAAAS